MTTRPTNTQLFETSSSIVDGLKNVGIDVADIIPHDPSDPESSDHLWLIKTPDDDLCEGEYLSVSEWKNDASETTLIMVDLNHANCFGGHPTVGSHSFSPAEQSKFSAIMDSLVVVYGPAACSQT